MAEIAVRDEEPKKKEYAKPKKLCAAPVKIVGVQDKTPLSWDSSGKRFAFASNNRSYLTTAQRMYSNTYILDYY